MKISIPQSPKSHKDLLKLSLRYKIISEDLMNEIGEYLTFRHFFSHSYGFLIDEEKLKPLIDNILETCSKFEEEISKFLLKVKEKNK